MTADAEAWCVQVAGQRRPRPLEGRTVAEVFTAAEAPALLPLPEQPFEPATWSRPKVAPDAHVIVGGTLYSVPWRLIGKRLDARATAGMVEFYLDGQLVKTHAFQPRGRRTDWADLPEHQAGFFMRTPAWCHAQAGMVGPPAPRWSASCWRSTRCSGCGRPRACCGWASGTATAGRLRRPGPATVLPHRQGHPARPEHAVAAGRGSR